MTSDANYNGRVQTLATSSVNTNNSTEDNNNKKVLSAAQMGSLKQLRVQSGALKRYTKEIKLYLTERDDEQHKLQEMLRADEQKCELKQQRQCIKEIDDVLLDLRPKLIDTWETVSQLMDELKDILKAEDEDLFANVQKYLSEAEAFVNN